jgi:iron complex transport system permease protein
LLAAAVIEIESLGLTYFFATAGCLVPVIIIFYALSEEDRASTVGPVIIGLVLSFLFLAIIVFYLSFLDTHSMHSYSFWLVGNLGETLPRRTFLSLPTLVSAFLLIYYLMWELYVSRSRAGQSSPYGDDRRFFSRRYVEGAVIILCSMMVAILVTIGGATGFVGLVSVWISRRLLGEDDRLLIPVTALLGAGLVLLCDTMARTIVQSSKVPTGSIAMFLGLPLLVCLAIQKLKK